MKSKKMSISACTLFLTVVLLLCSCTAVPEEKPAETGDAPVAQLVLTDDNKTEFSILRADNASEAIKKDTSALFKRLEKLTSVKFAIGNDFTKRGEEVDNSKPEILVGPTNRQASIDFIASLPENSFGVRVTEDKIVITGTDDTLTAYALYLFEDKYLYEDKYKTENGMAFPVGSETIFTNSGLSSLKSIMKSNKKVLAYTDNNRNLSAINGFGTGQGAACDGTYFYNVLKKNVGGVETDIIVKSKMSDFSTVLVSKELPLDHANDMCYNSKENILVVPTMKNGKIAIIDPENLTIIKTVDVFNTIGEFPYAVSYNAKRNQYTVAGGGRICITDSDFKILSTISYHSEPYTGQGMDSDDEFIYMPLSSAPDKGTTDNIIIVYDWETGYVRTIPLELTIESESMLNYNGKYYINFNTNGARISDLYYAVIYQ